MKKLRTLSALILTLVLVLAMPLQSLAATHYVSTAEQLKNAIDTDEDGKVIIYVTDDIELNPYNGDYLTTGEGQFYYIDSRENTISNMVLGGDGTVVLKGNLEGNDAGDEALHLTDNVKALVMGSISGTYDGLDMDSDSKALVFADIEGRGDGVDADDDAAAIIFGDITSSGTPDDTDYYITGDGIDADDDAKLIVFGDVTSLGDNGIEADDEDSNDAFIFVWGDVWGEDDGVQLEGNPTAVIIGDVTGETDDGAELDYDAKLILFGDISGTSDAIDADGSDNNIFAFICGNVIGADDGDAIEAEGTSQITVMGGIDGDVNIYDDAVVNYQSVIMLDGGLTIFR